MKTLITALSVLCLLASCNEPQHDITVNSMLFGEENAITADSLTRGQEVWISYDLAGHSVAYNISDKGNSIGHRAFVK